MNASGEVGNGAQLILLRSQPGFEESFVEFTATLLVERIVIRVRSLVVFNDCQCELRIAES